MAEIASEATILGTQHELRGLSLQLAPPLGVEIERHLSDFILDQDDHNVQSLADLVERKIAARNYEFSCVGGPATTANVVLGCAVAGDRKFFSLRSNGQVIQPSLNSDDRVLLVCGYANSPDALTATVSYCLREGVSNLATCVVLDGSAGQIAEAMEQAGIVYDYLLTTAELGR